jgi:hypothetical protein
MPTASMGLSVGVDEYVPKFEPHRLAEVLGPDVQAPGAADDPERWSPTNCIDKVDSRTKLAGSNKMELLLFSLGTSEIFGINVFKVREVSPTPPITLTPNMPALASRE